MIKGVLYGVGRAIGWPGTKVAMKARRSLDDVPDRGSYFSTMVVR